MSDAILATVARAFERQGPLLAYASIEGILVVAIVWLVCRSIARSAPSLRCALWWTACLKLLVGLSGIVLVSLPLLPASPPPHELQLALRNLPASNVYVSQAAAEPSVLPWRALLLGLWTAGVLAGLGLTVRQMAKAHAVIRRSTPISDRRLLTLLDDLSARVGLERSPDLRVSDEVSIPQVVGVLSPVVILPRARLEAFSEPDLAMALCHELVHVRRKDLWLGWVPALVRRVFFFHPAALVADHEYRIAREAACDAEVLRVLGGSAFSYGRLLLKMSARPNAGLIPSAAVASTFLDLQRRLHMLEHAQGAPRARKLHWTAVAVLALAILVPVRMVARASDPASEPLPAKKRMGPTDMSPITGVASDPAGEPLPMKRRMGPTDLSSNAEMGPMDLASNADVASDLAGDFLPMKRRMAPGDASADGAVASDPAGDPLPMKKRMGPGDPSPNTDGESDPAGDPLPAKKRMGPIAPSPNAYVLFLSDHEISMSGSVDGDLPRARAARGSAKGEFLWFRLGDDAYVVREAKVIGLVRELQAAASQSESAQEDLDRKSEAVSSKVQALTLDAEKVSAKMERLTEKRDELLQRQDRDGKAAADERASALLEKLNDEIRKLQDKQKEIEQAIESLSQKEETLGQEQERIGEESDRNSRVIDEKIYRLLEESISAGYAERVP